MRRGSWSTVGRSVGRALVAAACLMAIAVVAAPQQADAQGRPILVVPFERDNIDDLFFSTLMKRAHQSASGAQGYVSLDPVDNSMEDMLFAVGCAESSSECLQMLAESFSAEVILHGKVWGNERGIYLELHLFDAQLGNEILDQPIQKSFESAEKEMLLQMAIGEIQQIFYPFTGELTIASTEPATTIIFDGAEVGNTSNGPVKLTGLKLGEHTVTAQKGEDETTQTVVVLHDKPESITLDPGANSVGPIVGGNEGPSHTGSYIAFGVGGASLITGAIFSVLVNAENAEVERLAELDPVPSSEANSALKSGDQLQALQFVFYTVGAVAVGAGAVLYFMEGGEEAPAVGYIAPFLTPDGVGASVGGSF